MKVNGASVLELSHSEVVALIQGLPKDFQLVVARKREEVEPITAEVELDTESQPNETERPGERSF